jgi:hypothetical protein
MTFGEVRRALGRPSAVLKRKDFGFGSAYVEYQWRGGEWNVGVLGRPGRQSVVMVSTNLRAQRTRSGVGVASTERAVGRRLGARCTRHIIEGGWMFDGLCYTGRRGGVQTVFRLGGTCLLPARTYYVCPSARRRYTVYEVVVANASGLSLTGISIP